MGQAVIKLTLLSFDPDRHYLVGDTEMMLGNYKVADMAYKLRFEVTK